MSDLPVSVSFGGGVQSTAILHLVIDGKLPRPDLWVFADTGDEPRAVYNHVDRCASLMKSAGFRLEIVTRPDLGKSLSDHVLTRAEAGERGISMPPMFVAAESGAYPVRRGCTFDFKSKAIDRKVKEVFGIKRGRKAPEVVQWLGISLDETQRMRVSTDKWRLFHYPLIELVPMRRAAIVRYLRGKGIDAPRSACTYCPFHSNAEWRRVRQDREAWASAVEFERRVQAAYDEHGHVAGLASKPYLHRQRVPLEDADLGDGQLDLFYGMDNECAGICGV